MASQRHIPSSGGGAVGGSGSFGDTTWTKIFVGGLAWETRRDTMRRYFEQFGDILEAVVITDRNTGRSKGYGFVTFKDAESAKRACDNPAPVIDGRRANCNLAVLGTTNNRSLSSTNQNAAVARARAVAGSGAYQGSSLSVPAGSYIYQPAQYTWPYYGYAGGISQGSVYPNMASYYNALGADGLSPFQQYYTATAGVNATPAPGLIQNYIPYNFSQYGQSSYGSGSNGIALQYPQMIQYSAFPQQYQASRVVYPTAVAPTTSGTKSATAALPSSGTSSSRSPPNAQDHQNK